VPEWLGVLVYLIYGTSFFALGLSAFFSADRREVTVLFLRELPLLGWFGVSHAIVEWLTLFLRYYCGPDLYLLLSTSIIFLMAISYLILLQFGVGLEISFRRLDTRLSWFIPLVLALLLILASFLVADKSDVVKTFNRVQTIVRVGIALPASIMVAIGMHDCARRFDPIFGFRISLRFRLLSLIFIFYGALAGLVTDPWRFLQIFAFPVEVLRAVLALTVLVIFIGATRSMRKLLDERFRHMRSETILQQERERIGRELHDRVIQVLFASGLRLEQFAETKRLSSQELENVELIRKGLVELTKEIRTFIGNSDTGQLWGVQVVSLVMEHCDALQATFPVTISVVTDIMHNQLFRLHIHSSEDLRAILTEAVSNAVRHGRAKAVIVRLSTTPGTCNLLISDDGIGFQSETIVEGRGIASMRKRMAIIGGDMSFKVQNGTTTLSLVWPLEDTDE